MKVSVTIEAQGLTTGRVVLWQSNEFEMNTTSTHKFIESTQKTLNKIVNSKENGNESATTEGKKTL